MDKQNSRRERPPSYNSALNQDYTPSDIGWNSRTANYDSINTPIVVQAVTEPVINRKEIFQIKL